MNSTERTEERKNLRNGINLLFSLQKMDRTTRSDSLTFRICRQVQYKQNKKEVGPRPQHCSNLSSELEQSCFGSPDRPQASWSSAHPHTVGWAWVEGKAHWTWYLFLCHETEASLPSSLLTSHGPLVSVDSTIGLRPVTVSTIGLRTVATCCIILSIISWFSFPTCCLIIATSWLVILAGATAGRGLAGGATTARLASAAICEDPSAGGCLVPSF